MDLPQTTVDEQWPLPMRTAWPAVGRCVLTTVGLLAGRRVHQPRNNVGKRLWFGDGTSALVYRETVLERPAPREPCVLVVQFRLRWVHGTGHAVFRAESLLNTPLFVGFPGLVSKLWLGHDRCASYRGLYEWDGADAARAYARALWRVLALVSVPGSIRYRVVPGCGREDLLAALPASPDVSSRTAACDWWRPVAVAG